jgi:hypothetical protein
MQSKIKRIEKPIVSDYLIDSGSVFRVHPKKYFLILRLFQNNRH